MSVRIGIPRSLFYYKFIPLWESFFNKLGVEVVVSDPTNKHILDDGVKACVDEACLPIKLFHGHVINLKDRVDYILVPRFTSISKKEYICPEFGGLPDMIRHTLNGLPALIDTEINLRNSNRSAIKAAIKIGAMLGADRHAAKAAYRAAITSYRDFRHQALCGIMPFGGGGRIVNANGNEGRTVSPYDEDGRTISANGEDRRTIPAYGRGGRTIPAYGRGGRTISAYGEGGETVPAGGMRIAVIGHPYNVYDKYISMDLIGKLKRYGITAITVEMINESDINMQASLLSKPMFWNYGRNAYGAALHMATSGEIDGMICVTSFGCGIDSFVYDLIERRVRKEYKIPFITITLDEHSGEAGFNTRLEAFADMLHWRRLHENNISAFG